MTGQIPKYGRFFRLDHSRPYPTRRRYMFKPDESWWIESDHTSKVWTIYHNDVQFEETLPSLTAAMSKLTAGASDV